MCQVRIIVTVPHWSQVNTPDIVYPVATICQIFIEHCNLILEIQVWAARWNLTHQDGYTWTHRVYIPDKTFILYDNLIWATTLKVIPSTLNYHSLGLTLRGQNLRQVPPYFGNFTTREHMALYICAFGFQPMFKTSDKGRTYNDCFGSLFGGIWCLLRGRLLHKGRQRAGINLMRPNVMGRLAGRRSGSRSLRRPWGWHTWWRFWTTWDMDHNRLCRRRRCNGTTCSVMFSMGMDRRGWWGRWVCPGRLCGQL